MSIIDNFFNLGLFINKDKLSNHRTLPKILFNPILRIFGYQIVSDVSCSIEEKNGTEYGSVIIKITKIQYSIRKTERKSLKWDLRGKKINEYTDKLSLKQIKIQIAKHKGKIR